MNRYISCFILLALVIMQSCRKDDKYVFNESPNARVTASLEQYQKILTDGTTGWLGILYPAGDTTKAFSFYFKFDTQNRVSMLSDFTDSFATKPRESSYLLKALQTPALIFDTYNYLHVLADPNPSASGNGGSVGEGLSSDFEFAFDSATTKPDALTLIGRKRNSILKLRKLSSSEAATVAASGLQAGRLFSNISKYLQYFKRITINGTVYQMNVNTEGRTIIFSWVDASGTLHTLTVPFSYGVDGVIFSAPVTLGGQSIAGLNNLTWDASNLSMTFNINGTVTTVAGASAPVKVDTSAARNWWAWAKSSVYVSSDYGFHVNGVDDAFGMRSLAGFSRLDYYPVASAPYDYLRIAASTSYGPALLPDFGNRDKVVFPNTGFVFGTVPAAAVSTYQKILAQVTSPAGYYLIQISGGTNNTTVYDMVSAADGKAWLRWRY